MECLNTRRRGLCRAHFVIAGHVLKTDLHVLTIHLGISNRKFAIRIGMRRMSEPNERPAPPTSNAPRRMMYHWNSDEIAAQITDTITPVLRFGVPAARWTP